MGYVALRLAMTALRWVRSGDYLVDC